MKTITKTVLGGLAAIVLSMQLSGCGSCANGCNDISRSAIRRNYQLTFYSADGHIIKQETLKNTYINSDENGSGLKYLKNGKVVMLNGTYFLEEE